MRSWWPILGLLLAPGLAFAEAKTPTITKPDWAERPSGEEFAENYPKLAQLLEVEGRAQISCAVTDKGLLQDCVVDTETPGEMGFGAAAIRISSAFKMRPQTVDGQPVAGVVCIPLRFTLPPVPTASTPAPAPAPASVATAYRIVDAMNLAQVLLATYEAGVAAIENDPSQDLPEASRKAGAAALRAAIGHRRDDVRHALALTLAETYSPDELSRTADFAESPASAVLRDGEGVIARALSNSGPEIEAIGFAELKTAICEHLPCPAGSPEPTVAQPRSPSTTGTIAARRLIMAFNYQEQMVDQLEPGITRTITEQFGGASADRLKPVGRSLAQRIVTLVIDKVAAALAAEYPEAQIIEAADFFSTPTGQSLRTPRLAGGSPTLARLGSQIAAEARAIYCRTQACSPSAAAPRGVSRR